MKCSRCQNEDVQYFFENNGRIYCRKCIAFSTKTVNLKSVKNEKKIYYHLNYSLNLEQERTSRLLIERYQNHQNSVLKAVTGAGKTEMIYGVIEYRTSCLFDDAKKRIGYRISKENSKTIF